MLVVAMTNRLVHPLDPDGLKVHCDLSGVFAHRLNDMVIDAQGRAFVEALEEGKIILVTPDGEARIVGHGYQWPNGPVITPDGKTLIVSEFGSRLMAADIQPDGTLLSRRVWADLSMQGAMMRALARGDLDAPLGQRSMKDILLANGLGAADGMCVDAEGAIWVGAAHFEKFMRVKRDGEITHQIHTPGKSAIACMLGGDDRRTLFMMCNIYSVHGLPQRQSKGFILTARVDVPGAGWP